MLRGKCIVSFLYSFLGSNDLNSLIGMSTGILPVSLTELLLESIVHGFMCLTVVWIEDTNWKQMARLTWNYADREKEKKGVLFLRVNRAVLLFFDCFVSCTSKKVKRNQKKTCHKLNISLTALAGTNAQMVKHRHASKKRKKKCC